MKLNERKHRRSVTERKTLVRNREAGEKLRGAKLIECPICCDMPWRRRGVCAGCRLPYQEEKP